MQNSSNNKCIICLRESNLNHDFFELKANSPMAKKLKWKPYRLIESIWTQDFLNTNFANNNRKLCRYCVLSIRKIHGKLHTKFRTLPYGVKEDFGPFAYVLSIVIYKQDNAQYSKPLWEWSCCETIANRINYECKQRTNEKDGLNGKR